MFHQAVEKLLAAVNLPSKKAKLKQLKEIIARSFEVKLEQIAIERSASKP